jgi:hypothetical protein
MGQHPDEQMSEDKGESLFRRLFRKVRESTHPSGEDISSLKGALRAVMLTQKVKRDQQRRDQYKKKTGQVLFIPPTLDAELTEEQLNLVLTKLLAEYREKRLTEAEKFTVRAADRVLSGVRRQQEKDLEQRRLKQTMNEARELLFWRAFDSKVDDLEELVALQVIEKVEYYLLLANVDRVSLVDSAELIKWPYKKAWNCLQAARRKVQRAWKERLSGAEPQPTPEDERERTVVDDDLLNYAIWNVGRRSIR